MTLLETEKWVHGLLTVACLGARGPAPENARDVAGVARAPATAVRAVRRVGVALALSLRAVGEARQGGRPRGRLADVGDRLTGVVGFECSKQLATEEPVGKREAGRRVMGGGPDGIVTK